MDFLLVLVSLESNLTNHWHYLQTGDVPDPGRILRFLPSSDGSEGGVVEQTSACISRIGRV